MAGALIGLVSGGLLGEAGRSYQEKQKQKDAVTQLEVKSYFDHLEKNPGDWDNPELQKGLKKVVGQEAFDKLSPHFAVNSASYKRQQQQMQEHAQAIAKLISSGKLEDLETAQAMLPTMMGGMGNDPQATAGVKAMGTAIGTRIKDLQEQQKSAQQDVRQQAGFAQQEKLLGQRGAQEERLLGERMGAERSLIGEREKSEEQLATFKGDTAADKAKGKATDPLAETAKGATIANAIDKEFQATHGTKPYFSKSLADWNSKRNAYFVSRGLNPHTNKPVPEGSTYGFAKVKDKRVGGILYPDGSFDPDPSE